MFSFFFEAGSRETLVESWHEEFPFTLMLGWGWRVRFEKTTHGGLHTRWPYQRFTGCPGGKSREGDVRDCKPSCTRKAYSHDKVCGVLHSVWCNVERIDNHIHVVVLNCACVTYFCTPYTASVWRWCPYVHWCLLQHVLSCETLHVHVACTHRSIYQYICVQPGYAAMQRMHTYWVWWDYMYGCRRPYLICIFPTPHVLISVSIHRCSVVDGLQ